MDLDNRQEPSAKNYKRQGLEAADKDHQQQMLRDKMDVDSWQGAPAWDVRDKLDMDIWPGHKPEMTKDKRNMDSWQGAPAWDVKRQAGYGHLTGATSLRWQKTSGIWTADRDHEPEVSR